MVLEHMEKSAHQLVTLGSAEDFSKAGVYCVSLRV